MDYFAVVCVKVFSCWEVVIFQVAIFWTITGWCKEERDEDVMQRTRKTDKNKAIRDCPPLKLLSAEGVLSRSHLFGGFSEDRVGSPLDLLEQVKISACMFQ